MSGKYNLFVINTQCQIKNKQLLCFSWYLQHLFNYFDPIQGGNEELDASDVDKLAISALCPYSCLCFSFHYLNC